MKKILLILILFFFVIGSIIVFAKSLNGADSKIERGLCLKHYVIVIGDGGPCKKFVDQANGDVYWICRPKKK